MKSKQNSNISIKTKYGFDLSSVKLTDVIDIEFLQRFQDDFATGVGLASVTVDPQGNPVTKSSKYIRFCKDYTHSTECGDRRCAESHRKGGEEAARTGKPVVYECHAGLIDFAAPIMLEGRLIGTILGGQVLTAPPEEEKYRRIAKEIGVDPDEYVEASKEARVLSKEAIEAAANVLYIVANSMSLAAHRQNMVLTSLHEMALDLMANFDQEDALKKILLGATELFDAPHGFVHLVDEEMGTFTLKIGTGAFYEFAYQGKLIDGLVGQAYRTGRIVAVNDYSVWDNRLPQGVFDEMHYFVLVPIKVGQRMIGAFGLAYSDPGRILTDLELSLLQSFADLASVALNNAMLVSDLVQSEKKLQKNNEDLIAAHEELIASEEELRQQFDELMTKEAKIYRQNLVLAALHETALNLMHRLELEDVLKMITSSATELVGAPHGFVYMVDEEAGVFFKTVAIGKFAQSVAWQIKVTEGILGEVYKTGQVVVINDYSTWEHQVHFPGYDELHYSVVIPLKERGRIIGVLGVAFSETGRMLTDDDISSLQQLADLASLALDNAMLVASYKNEIEERKRMGEDLRSSKNVLSMAATLANLGPWEYNHETDIFEFGDEFYAIYGTDVAREGRFMSSAVYGREFVYQEDACIVATEIEKIFSSRERCYSRQLEHRIIRRDGEVRTVVVRIGVIRDASGKIIKIYGTNQDITERVRAEETLRQQAETIQHMVYFDSLTGLPNRRYLNEWLHKELERARRSDSSGIVFFIDLDNLKMINDTYGHTCGDDIINAAGTRIAAAVDENAFIARIGGDEFIIIQPGKRDSEQIDEFAVGIIKALGQEHETFGTHFHMTASIGIAAYPADGDTADEIIKNADNAMYAAKKDGKNCWRFYTESLQSEAYEKMRLTASLRYALERREFFIVYQPQILSAEGSVIGFEALLRWNSSEHGAVSPGQFIPLVEQGGLIHSIGLWVLREACRFVRRLSDQGWGEIHVAVNISPLQLAADDFIVSVQSAVADAGIKPRQLELEITESVLITSLENATDKLAELKAMGVGLSMDDFGTGYSSLTYLRKLPVETLKIDKSFIDMITTEAHTAKIIGTIINMAHILDMAVVAEGVETEQQLKYLADNGCDCIQGYIYGRPMPESEVIKFLAVFESKLCSPNL